MDISDVYGESTKEIVNGIVINNSDSFDKFPTIKKLKL
tara:strand:- start:1664 stop:1777 length:114 start_codon:yes stop_codon:yes gene_type:complete